MPSLQKTVMTLVATACISFCAQTQDSESEEPSFAELKSIQTRKLCVNYLDGYLCLSREQKDAMEDLFEEHWNQNYDSIGRSLFWAGFSSMRECLLPLKPAILAEILSEDQLLQFESLPEHALNQSAQLSYLRNLTDDEVDPLEVTLNVAKNLEIQRLNALLILNEAQLKTLRVAANGATNTVLGQRKTWKEKISSGGKLGVGWVPIAVEAPAFRIRNTKIWQKTLKNILREDQLSILAADQRASFIDSAKASAHSLALGYFRQEGLSRQEFMDFSNLLIEAIQSAQEADEIVAENSLSFEIVAILVRLEDAKIKKVLSQNNWATLSPILNQIRNNFEDQNDEEERCCE